MTETFFLRQLINSGTLNFDLNIVRVANKPLSSQQEKFVNMDDASRQSMNILSSIGAKTGVDFKEKEEVKAFFKTGKTINPEDYGK